MKKLLIRTDMNCQIATGHMMRCLAIADAASKAGVNVFFVSADENARSLVESRGYTYISLETHWDKMYEELPKLERVIYQLQPDCILVDSYYVTIEYMKKVRSLAKVAYIDDLCKEVYPCDALICYANYYKKYNYLEIYPEQIKLFLGCDYVPLRKSFANIKKREIEKSAKEVLLLSGGTDPYHFLKSFLRLRDERIDAWNEIKLVVICGIYNTDYKEIIENYAQDQQIEILINVSNIEHYMQRADVAISAAGTSLYELCACGTPTVCYTFAENQLENAKQFDLDDVMIYAGDLRDESTMLSIINKTETLISDFSKRNELSRKMMQLVDGQGAFRIIKKMEEVM